MRHSILLFGAIALLIAAGSPAGTAEPAGERVRLMLTNGASYDARGPVTEKNGLLLFYTLDGKLSSIRASEVREVRPAAGEEGTEQAAAPRPAPGAPAAAAGTGSAIPRFSNADLTPLPPPVEAPAAPAGPPAGETPAAPPTAEPGVGTPAAAPAPAAPPPPPAPLVATPTVVAGHDEAWWRNEVGRRRTDIAALERREALVYRLLVCEQQGIPLTGGQCAPQPGRLPPINQIPSTPTEKSLTAQLTGVRGELERRRAELSEFLEGGIAAGVPTSWLLEGAAAVEERRAVPEAAEQQGATTDDDGRP